MKNLLTALLLTSFMFSAYATADTLELADGTLLEGSFVGSSNGIVMFNTGAGIEAFQESEVVGIFLSSGVATATAERQQEEQRQQAQAKQKAPAKPAVTTVPAGTRLVIRMVDSVDSRRHQAGHRFRGQLESALAVNGVSVVPRGTFVHGRVVQQRQAGRAAGSSEMSIEFTDIMIDDQLFPITTEGMNARTGNEAARTAGRTARAAVIGGLIDGSSGAKTGAAVGAGASLLTRGASVNITAGTILETTLKGNLELPR